MNESDGVFNSLFGYFGFSELQVKQGLRIARKEDLGRKSDRQLRGNTHISSRKTTKWESYFDAHHKEAFKNRFEMPW